MKLEGVKLAIDQEGFATVVGYLRGKASDTRAKWDIGFGVARQKGELIFLAHDGNPARPVVIVPPGLGIRFMEACVKKGCYRAVTMVDWEAEQVSDEGWMTAFSPNPVWTETVNLGTPQMEEFNRILNILVGGERIVI